MIIGTLTYAQNQDPVATLVYYDDETSLIIYDDNNTELFPEFGMELTPGYSIDTGLSNVEIELQPNGTIVKLSPDTVFSIDALQGREQATSNTFSLVSGKMRAVAARAVGDESYTVKTQTAIAGVRGTDFAMQYTQGVVDATFVFDGLVEVTNLKTGTSVAVPTGKGVDTFGEVFQPTVWPAAKLSNLVENLDFESLSPDNVPGHEVSTEQKTGEEETPPEEPKTTVEEPTPEEPTPEEPATEEPTDQTIITEQPIDKTPGNTTTPEGGGMFAGFANLFDLEIGSMTVGETTYSKAIIQPRFVFGKLKLGLYLPIVYSKDILDPGNWYQPGGNNEWSFGSDQDNDYDLYTDLFQDLALKIRYLEYGDPQTDNFYLKFGNLKTMTIGDGFLMNNYANDIDFPAVRKVGINAGLKGKKAGMEAVVDDLGDPDIMGGRFSISPLWSGFELGYTVIADTDPIETIETMENKDPYGKPIMVGTSLDMSLINVQTSLFGFKLFVDGGTVIPYLKESMDNPSDNSQHLSNGFQTDYIYRDSKLYNWGAMTGAIGHIFIVDYRLDYRYGRNTFAFPYFNANYDRTKGKYIYQMYSYLSDPDNSEYDITTMGIYGESGINLFDAIRLSAGYLWPWEIDESDNLKTKDEDYFKLELSVKEGVIPVLGLYGSVSYERTYFIPTIQNKGNGKDLSLFDAFTAIKGEIVYPVTEGLDIAFMAGTTTLPDKENPDKIQTDSQKNPKIVPSYTIETRINF